MISYVTVFEDEIKYYKALAPQSMLLDLADNGNYMLGAVDESGKAVGALGFEMVQEISEENPYVVIKWLYVDEKQRSKGIGHGLINEMVSVLDESGMSDLRVEIPYPDTYNDITGFFKENGFDFIYTDSYEFRSSVEKLRKNELLNKKVNSLKIVPLSKVSRGIYIDGVRNLARLQLKEKASRVILEREEYDEELSMAYIEDDMLKGIYLVKKMHDSSLLSGNLFCVKQNIGVISYNLLKEFVKTADNKCPAGTIFRIRCQREPSRRLMELLIPDWMGEIIRIGNYRK